MCGDQSPDFGNLQYILQIMENSLAFGNWRKYIVLSSFSQYDQSFWAFPNQNHSCKRNQVMDRSVFASFQFTRPLAEVLALHQTLGWTCSERILRTFLRPLWILRWRLKRTDWTAAPVNSSTLSESERPYRGIQYQSGWASCCPWYTSGQASANSNLCLITRHYLWDHYSNQVTWFKIY